MWFTSWSGCKHNAWVEIYSLGSEATLRGQDQGNNDPVKKKPASKSKKVLLGNTDDQRENKYLVYTKVCPSC